MRSKLIKIHFPVELNKSGTYKRKSIILERNPEPLNKKGTKASLICARAIDCLDRIGSSIDIALSLKEKRFQMEGLTKKKFFRNLIQYEKTRIEELKFQLEDLKKKETEIRLNIAACEHSIKVFKDDFKKGFKLYTLDED